MGQNGVSSNHLTKAERIQAEDYNDWPGYSKIGFSPVRSQQDGEVREKEAAKAQASTAVSCPARALCDCDGSLWRRELLGKGNEGFGA